MPIEKSMNTESKEHAPWYKEPMVWLVAGLPLLAICWGFVMLTLALESKDSLVSDSYYKDGVSYTENVEADAHAARLQIKADLTFSENEIHLALNGYLDEEPATLQLQLIHPTLQERDLTVLLQRLGDGHYAGVNELVLPERRHIWLLSHEQQWRIRGTELIEADKVINLHAK
jgi:hypothetical protein